MTRPGMATSLITAGITADGLLGRATSSRSTDGFQCLLCEETSVFNGQEWEWFHWFYVDTAKRTARRYRDRCAVHVATPRNAMPSRWKVDVMKTVQEALRR